MICDFFLKSKCCDTSYLLKFFIRIFVVISLTLCCLTSNLQADDNLNDRLQTVEEQAGILGAIINFLDLRGRAVDYPATDLAVLKLCIDYTATDIANGYEERAENSLNEMEDLVLRCKNDLIRIFRNNDLGPVPYYSGKPVSIDNNHFRAEVNWPDGTITSDWPVIFNGYVGFEKLQSEIEDVASIKTSLVSVEIGPSEILVTEDEVDKTSIYSLISFLDRAHSLGIAVNLLISPHYFPQWAFEKWPDILINAGEYCPYSVDAIEVRDIMEQYLGILMPEIEGHPALMSLCLENEPSYFGARIDPLNRSRYSGWLQDQYGTVEAVSAAHGENYTSFDDVPLFYGYDWEVQPTGGNPAAVYDFFRFNDERFADWFWFLANLVHEDAPELPVHVKIPDFVHVSPLDGIEPGQFAEFSQIAGNDAIKVYTVYDDNIDYANDWLSENFYFDLLRSLYGMPLFNSEDHIIRDQEDDFIPPEHVRNVLWQAAIHGQGASNVWLWEREGMDEETGEPDLSFTSLMQQPALIAEHARTGLDLMRLAREVSSFVDVQPKIALLYSPTALIYTVDHERLSYALYEALNFTGIKIGFVSEAQVSEDSIPDSIKLIIIAGVSHLTDSAYEGLVEFQQNGGLLAGVGNANLTHDHYNNPFLEQVAFDFTVDDIPANELHPYLIDWVENLAAPPVNLVDPSTGVSPWGVEWRTAEFEGQLLINMTNYNKETQIVRLVGDTFSEMIDLITGTKESRFISLAPLEVKMIKCLP